MGKKELTKKTRQKRCEQAHPGCRAYIAQCLPRIHSLHFLTHAFFSSFSPLSRFYDFLYFFLSLIHPFFNTSRIMTTYETANLYIVHHNYDAEKGDELTLQVGDIINVSDNSDPGWWVGERVKDGQAGWFPANVS